MTRKLIKMKFEIESTVVQAGQRTCHVHLEQHMYSKLKTSDLDQWPCSTGEQTTVHLLQICNTHETLRRQTRTRKCDLEDLQPTAIFIDESRESM
ncbi:hypothetical protein ElyMa_005851600 [Elysia marginata]|uniref:Uncharacterized protein n=1 Tax=Elysia marginata TaxID=1093978 RepID=A0AAV4FYW2_9GAST|nr:hypothetical protein ElyMa_005851600 [Elysia marginata]